MTPITIQTYGVYDDYGQVAIEEGWHQSYVEQVFREHAVALPQGPNSVHDIPIVPVELGYEMIQTAVHEGRLYVRPPSLVKQFIGSGVRVTRMMIHRFIFDDFVAQGIHGWSNHLTLPVLVDAGMALRSQGPMDYFTLERFILRGGNPFAQAFQMTEGGDYYVPHNFRNYLELIGTISDGNALSLITELSKFMIVRHHMQLMQFLWTPQIASQRQEYEALSRFYRLCDDYAQRRIHEDDEDERKKRT